MTMLSICVDFAHQVDHVTFRLGEGKVVLLGGLARVEVVTGRPFLLTFFVSNDVRLHPTDTSRCVWALVFCCCCCCCCCCRCQEKRDHFSCSRCC